MKSKRLIRKPQSKRRLKTSRKHRTKLSRKHSRKQRTKRSPFDGMKRGRDDDIKAEDTVTKRNRREELDLEKKKPGLLIKDTLVSQIAGPMTLYILKPTVDFHKSHNAPIFILFGDVHHSGRNMCRPCECNNKSDCCYKVYSPDFLKLIDTIAEDHTVYFNVESHLKDNDINGFVDESLASLPSDHYMNYPLRELRSRLEPCYSKALKEAKKEKYNSSCPTQNIIWQRTDIRQFHGGFEECVDYFRTYVLQFRCAYNDLVLFKSSYSAYLPLFKQFLTLDFHKILPTVKLKDKTVSRIWKQINKMPVHEQKLWINYIDQYYTYFNTTQRKLSDEDVSKFEQLIQDIIDDKFTEASLFFDNIETVYKISLHMLYYTNFSLDLYFLTRNFKTTNDGKNPLVSIGYFGALHSYHIKYFLTNIMGNYTTTFVSMDDDTFDVFSNNKINPLEVNRCIKITERIDLDEMIHELISMKT